MIFMPKIQIDAPDREILYELTTNARRQNNRMARDIGISNQLFDYRVSRMIKTGIVPKFIPLVRIDSFGMGFYRALLRIEKASAKRKHEIKDYITNNKSVFQLIEAVGSWDLSVNFVCRDIRGFNAEIDKLATRFSENIRQYTTMAFSRSVYFNRRFFTKRAPEAKTAMLYGGSASAEHLDDKDLLILDQLFKNARMPNFTISKNTKIAMNTIKSRIRSMENRGVIQGYRAFLRPMPFGVVRKKVMVRSYCPVRTEQLLNDFALNNPHVYVIEKMSGRWDFEVVLEAFGHREFQGILQKMRDAISEVPFDYEMIDIAYNHDMNFGSLLAWGAGKK